jgi:hypothetical protein
MIHPFLAQLDPPSQNVLLAAIGLPASPAAGIVWDYWVSATDTVTVRASNITASPVDPASATYKVKVFAQ